MATTSNIYITPFLNGGLSDLPIESIYPNQTNLIENMDIQVNKLVRRNHFTPFNPTPHGVGAFVKSFTLDGEPYLLTLDPFAVNATTNGVTPSIYNKNGTRLTNTLLMRNLGAGALNNYLHYPKELDPKEVFSIAVHNNTLYLLNNTIKVQMSDHGLNGSRSSLEQDNYTLFWVKETSLINGGYKYYLIDDDYNGLGVNYHWEQGIDSHDISKKLSDYIGANSQFYGNSFIVQNDTSWSVSDSFGGEAFKKIWREVETLEELPPVKLDQHYIYHTRNDGENYYIVYEWDSAKAGYRELYQTRIKPIESRSMKEIPYPAFPNVPHNNIPIFAYVEVLEGEKEGYFMVLKNGKWEEEISPNSKRFIRPETMPLSVKIENNKGVWDCMLLAQKSVTSNNPAFINKEIKGISFYKDRMVLTTDDTITFSGIIKSPKRAKEDNIYFFKTTAKKDIMSDVFNVGISNDRGDKIRELKVFRDNIFIISDNGLYTVQFQDSIVSLDTISITKSIELQINKIALTFDTMYIVNKTNLYKISDRLEPLGAFFKSYLYDIVDIAVSPITNQLFLLKKDKRILVYKYEVANGQPLIMGAYIWRTHLIFHAIEVIDNRLIGVGNSGLYALDLINKSYSFKDDGVTFTSRFRLPKYLERKNNINNMWAKFFYRRFESYFDGEYIFRMYRDNTLIEETETKELNVMQGNNIDTDIEILAKDDKLLDFYHTQFTIQAEQRVSK